MNFVSNHPPTLSCDQRRTKLAAGIRRRTSFTALKETAVNLRLPRTSSVAFVRKRARRIDHRQHSATPMGTRTPPNSEQVYPFDMTPTIRATVEDRLKPRSLHAPYQTELRVTWSLYLEDHTPKNPIRSNGAITGSASASKLIKNPSTGACGYPINDRLTFPHSSEGNAAHLLDAPKLPRPEDAL